MAAQASRLIGAHDPDVGLTVLPSGLRIVSQRMDHARRRSSLGIWIGAGARDELPHEHSSPICSSIWPSRARRGVAPARSPRRSRAPAATSPRPASNIPAHRARARPGPVAGGRHTLRYPHRAGPDRRGARPREGRDPAGDRRRAGLRRTTSVYDRFLQARLPRPAARPADPRARRRR